MALTAATDEEALAPISALQHYVFCPRQCALIHIERLWSEDAATVEGRLLHERADSGQPERRPGVRVLRGVAIRSLALGLAGKADVVEMRGRPPTPFPIEYKRGRPKAHRADEVQLCAQAIALEEMMGVPVPKGALYYGAVRRRLDVVFDQELRSTTRAAAEAMRAMLAEGRTPPPVYRKAACERCSLVTLCRPKRLEHPPRVGQWLARQLID